MDSRKSKASSKAHFNPITWYAALIGLLAITLGLFESAQAQPTHALSQVGFIEKIDARIALVADSRRVVGVYVSSPSTQPLLKGWFEAPVRNGTFHASIIAGSPLQVRGRIKPAGATGELVLADGTVVPWKTRTATQENEGIFISAGVSDVTVAVRVNNDSAYAFHYDSARDVVIGVKPSNITKTRNFMRVRQPDSLSTATRVLLLGAAVSHRSPGPTTSILQSINETSEFSACENDRPGSRIAAAKTPPQPTQPPDFRYSASLKGHLVARDPGGIAPGWSAPKPTLAWIKRQKRYLNEAKKLRQKWSASEGELEQALRLLKQDLLK